MSSLHNSYFQLFLEDLISLKEELLFDLNTDAANDEKIERFELASKTGNVFFENNSRYIFCLNFNPVCCSTGTGRIKGSSSYYLNNFV